jgi:hypothetical protein
MDKSQLVETLRRERAQWNELLSQVSAERKTQPGCAGQWSVKDIVAHVNTYEQWLVSWLASAKRGVLPKPSIVNSPDVDARNAVIYETNRHRPLGDVLAEAEQVFQQLVVEVESLPDEDLSNERRTAWFVEPFWKESIPLYQAIADDSYEHYHEHMLGIRAWLDAQRGPA